MACSGLVVGRGRRDVDVLPRPPFEQSDVALHLLRYEAYELADGIKLFTAYSTKNGLRVIYVGNDLSDILGNLVPAVSTIEQPHLVPAL